MPYPQHWYAAHYLHSEHVSGPDVVHEVGPGQVMAPHVRRAGLEEGPLPRIRTVHYTGRKRENFNRIRNFIMLLHLYPFLGNILPVLRIWLRHPVQFLTPGSGIRDEKKSRSRIRDPR
jgi:hypothetical protein